MSRSIFRRPVKLGHFFAGQLTAVIVSDANPESALAI